MTNDNMSILQDPILHNTQSVKYSPIYWYTYRITFRINCEKYCLKNSAKINVKTTITMNTLYTKSI